MRLNTAFSIFFILIGLSLQSVQAQEEKDSPALDQLDETDENYSVFNDFRIPTRENINESDLRYDGWKTNPGMYVFRCRNGKRVRLTLWYLDRGPKEVFDSRFINVTPALDKCKKKDITYNRLENKPQKRRR